MSEEMEAICLVFDGDGAAKDGVAGFDFQRITEGFTVGRSEKSSLCISSLQISRTHGCFTFKDGNCFFKDLNSTNGFKYLPFDPKTSFDASNFVQYGGEKKGAEVQVRIGDYLCFGTRLFKIVSEKSLTFARDTVRFGDEDKTVEFKSGETNSR